MKILWLPLLLSSVIWAEEDYFFISPDATWNDPGLHQSNATWNSTGVNQSNATWNSTGVNQSNATWNSTGVNQSNATSNETGVNQHNTTWDDARNHCQACFKELATITSRNVHLIVKNLSLDYWTGLRKSFNGTIPWSRWSNGDPVTYQNWYPGHPLPNTVKKMIPVCFSTTQGPLSTIITATTSTPVTSTNASTETPTQTSTQTSTHTSTQTPTQTSTHTSTQTSTHTSMQISTRTSTVTPEMSSIYETNNTNMCPILNEILDCLNMTDYELVRKLLEHTWYTPKTTTYSTTPIPTTHSTTPNATTYSTTPNATTFTTIFTTTGSGTENTTINSTTTESTTTSNCIFVPEPDSEVYIEDACVVLLSFGMWKERNCNETLPFICYDERFFGQINISDVTTRTGNVSWSNPPGNITHYRVEITGKRTKHTSNETDLDITGNRTIHTSNETDLDITGNQTKHTSNETDLYKLLQDLTPGNLYKVQVFPVKCGRDLNPQNISFYTRPSGVQNLTVVSVTTVTVSLNWSKPEGDSDFYSVLVTNMLDNSKRNEEFKKEECTITGLTPGNEYEFIVAAMVNKTTQGVPMNVSDYTIPSKVSELKSKDDHSTIITATWKAPFGNHSGYRYCLIEVKSNEDCTDCNIRTISNITSNSNNNNATNSNNNNATNSNNNNATNSNNNNATNSNNNNATNSNNNNATNSNMASICNITKKESIKEVNKIDGTKYCLCVAALTKNDTLAGEMVVIPAYTKPKNVSLTLTSTSKNITATWTIDNGNYEKFNVMITTVQDNKTNETTTTANLNYTFTGLKAGVEYNVSVITLNGVLKSDPTSELVYTYPTSPGPADAKSFNKTTIHVTWGVPEDSKGAVIFYKVDYYATFWDDRNHTENLKNVTEFTFYNLKPGTRYEFNVSVVAGQNTSLPVNAEAITDPEKRTLILTMLCSSQTPLHCENNITRHSLLEKLNNTIKGRFHEDVHWKLKWVKRDVLDP